ncbi:MAG: DUF4159 domain-containing protein [Flavobacteriales bacterium]|nr:DUF4159 domain-containing protein [Flavobacteriales bacterium]
MILFRIFILILLPLICLSQNTYSVATLKYNGGGDWYANPTALPNLIEFSNKNIGTNIKKSPKIVEVGSSDIFNYPFLHMTGHGNIFFNNEEANNLRKYLLSGGFLHVDDNYGLDEFFRKEITKVFPNKKLVLINSNHIIFNQSFKFPNGLPKIHIHDAKPSEAYGIFDNGRLICLYTYESDLSDGWEDSEVHNDSEETRLKALKMGSNIIEYVFLGKN